MLWRALFAILLLALATAGITTADDEALVFHVAESPLEIAFQSNSAPLRAAFDVTVENRSAASGKLRLELVLDGLDPLPAHDGPPPPDERALTLFMSSPTPSMQPGAIAQVRLGLHHGDQLAEKPRSGYLVATLNVAGNAAPVRSAFVPVIVAADASLKGLGEARPEPKSVTVIGTRAFPFGLFDSVWAGTPSYGVQLPGWNAKSTKKGGELGRTVLSSDSGGHLEAALGSADPAASPRTAVLTVLRADAAGKYSGDLVLDPSIEKSDVIGLTVNVQDLIVWPIIAVLIGTFVAWRLVVWRDQVRPREVLRERLKKAQNDYHKLYAKTVPRLPSHQRLDTVFPTGDWAPACPPPEGAPIGNRLYCDIGAAKTKEALDQVTAEVDKVIATASTWADTRDAIQTLRREVARSAKKLPGAAIIVRANKLLAGKLPTDPDDLRDHTIELQEQAKGIKLWKRLVELTIELSVLYQPLDDLGNELQLSVRQELQRHHPAGLLEGYLSTVRSLDELQDQEVLQKATESLAFLNALHAVYLGGGAKGVGYLIAPAQATMRYISIAANAIAAIKPAVPDRRTAEEIRRQIRWHDWSEFWVTFAITVLAVVITLYVDKDFGTPWQYLSALLAGAGGQVAVSWVLLPWYRSYAPPPPANPKSAPA